MTEVYRERAVSGIKARAIATKALIQNHQEEFNTLHGDARESFGLPRFTGPDKKAELLKKIAAQELKMTALREQLDKLS